MPMGEVIKMSRKRRFEEEYSFEREIQKEPDMKKGVVCNAPLVKVRKEPSGTSSTLKVLEKGDEVTILGKSTETFYKIDLGDDNIGYISCKYCEEVT